MSRLIKWTIPTYGHVFGLTNSLAKTWVIPEIVWDSRAENIQSFGMRGFTDRPLRNTLATRSLIAAFRVYTR